MAERDLDEWDREIEADFQRAVATTRSTGKRKRKSNEHFVLMPWVWIRKLSGAAGQTWVVACHVIYGDWKHRGKPFKFANGMLKVDGVPPRSKCRALRDLERRGLVAVDWREKKSPIVQRLI
jgi:hypothetical protein